MLESGIRASVPLAASHAMRNDHVAEEKFTPGVMYLGPDLYSAYLYLGWGPNKPVAMMTSFVESNGAAAASCPHGQLAHLSKRLCTEHRLAVLLGFEVEVVFMRAVTNGALSPVGNHSWCHVPAEDAEILQIVEEVVSVLARVNATVEKFHVEAAPDQWEFVSSPGTPVEAVDILLRARETVVQVAQQHDSRATLHPRPSCRSCRH
jgi:glutamine synthetase